MVSGEGDALSRGDIEALGYVSDLPEGVKDADSPPAEGVRQDAPRPGVTDTPTKLADGSDADKPVPYERFREVNDKARVYEELWGAMGLPAPNTPEFLEWAASQGQGAQEPEPRHEPAPTSDPGDDDTSAWLRREIREAIPELSTLGEVKEFVAAQKAEARRATLNKQMSDLKASHPDFNEATDLPALARAVKGGAPSLEAAYRIAFWDRRTDTPPRMAGQTHDLRGAPATASTDDLDSLFKGMQEADTEYDREVAAQHYLDKLLESKAKALGL